MTNMDHCSSAGVLDLHISDHVPVVLIKKKKKDSRENICFGGRGFINYSKDRLSDSLTNATKEIFRSTYDPNECCDLMQTFLEDFLDQTCPRKTF